MPAQRLKILVVDDNRDNCALLEDIFADRYNVTSVYSGEACLGALSETCFDLVLLDVNMPGMNGYEVCQKIRGSDKYPMVPVIFVSAAASTEERLRGYEAGAEDYITKPIDEDALISVVTDVLDQRQQQKKLEKQSHEAMQTAFQAMASSAELGLIIRYLQASYQCNAIDKLAALLSDTTRDYGLATCLLFRMQSKQYLFNCEQNSIEAKVLTRINAKHRIIDYGARTVINAPHITILIKNMPLDKPEDYGRIKDNLTVLIDGTEARCKAVEIEQQLAAERNKGLLLLTEKSQQRLLELRQIINRQKQTTDEVLSSIARQIEEIVFRLGLDDTEEQSILDAIDDAIVEAAEITRHSDELELNFERFVKELTNLSTG